MNDVLSLGVPAAETEESDVFAELAEAAKEARSEDPDALYAPQPWEEIIEGDHPVGKLKDRFVQQLYILLQRKRMQLDQIRINLLRRARGEGKLLEHPDYAEQQIKCTRRLLMNGILERIYGTHLRLAIPEIAMKPNVDLRAGWQVVWRDSPDIAPAVAVAENISRPDRLN